MAVSNSTFRDPCVSASLRRCPLKMAAAPLCPARPCFSLSPCLVTLPLVAGSSHLTHGNTHNASPCYSAIVTRWSLRLLKLVLCRAAVLCLPRALTVLFLCSFPPILRFSVHFYSSLLSSALRFSLHFCSSISVYSPLTGFMLSAYLFTRVVLTALFALRSFSLVL